MRGLIVLGALLFVIGLVVMLVPMSYVNRDHDVVGNMTRTESTSFYVPPVAGGAAIVGGLVLMLVGAAARPRYY